MLVIRNRIKYRSYMKLELYVPVDMVYEVLLFENILILQLDEHHS